MKAPFNIWRRGRYWYYRLPGEKTFHSTGCSNKRLATDFIYRTIQSHGQPKTTLEQYATDFFKWDVCRWIRRQHAKGRNFARTAAKQRRAHLEKYIFPQFGAIPLGKLNQNMIEDWLVSLALAGQTKNHILYTFRIVLRQAQIEKIIENNPLEKVDPFAIQARPRDCFTLDELRCLFPPDKEDMTRIWRYPKHAVCFYTLAATGIRSGEARALRWRHVLWEGGLLIQQAVKPDGEIASTKSGAERIVLAPSRLLELLLEWRRQTPYPDPEHLVFYGRDGSTPMSRNVLNKQLPKCLGRTTIEAGDRLLVVHSFRHTYNTIMRQILPEAILRSMIGHSSEEMTNRYDHPTVQDRLQKLLEVRSTVESIWKN
ncbi:MAG TPA: tyrosine-type recombinase/integrase [Spirochaetia bacterium]|nr:tyrosine-type recombinase/integrase [Spirochaetia bacterium]